MKATLLLMLFLVSLSMGVFASECYKKELHVRCEADFKEVKTKNLFDPSMLAEDINNCLYLTFRFSLYDADIVIKDKDGYLILLRLPLRL